MEAAMEHIPTTIKQLSTMTGAATKTMRRLMEGIISESPIYTRKPEEPKSIQPT